MATHVTYPKKIWKCKGQKPVGRPFGKYEIEYCKCGSCDGNLKRAFARQKCSCSQIHRVEYTPHWNDGCCSKKGNWNF